MFFYKPSVSNIHVVFVIPCDKLALYVGRVILFANTNTINYSGACVIRARSLFKTVMDNAVSPG